LRRLSILIGLVLFVVSSTVVSLRTAPAFGDRLRLDGRATFLAGANYPYKSSQDFGTGAWGYSGIAEPTTNLEVDTDLANLQASGARVIKWRLFNDGRYSPDFDQDGHAAGLDPQFYHDVDAALALAQRHDLQIIFTMFNSGFWTTDCVQKSVHLGGHADAFTDPIRRRELIDRAIIPALRHVGASDRVLGYEVIAEPEWGIADTNTDQDNRTKIPLAAVRQFVGEVAAAIHTYTPALATVESNRASNMAIWRGLGLDYYSFSWYDWMQPWEPLDRPAASFGLDRPIVLGEFPSFGSKYYPLSQIYDIVYRQGYAGAFAWSYGNNDQYSSWSQVDEEFARWMSEHWDVTAGSGSAPGSQVTLLPSPYQVQNVGVVEGSDGSYLQGDLRVSIPGTYNVQWFLYDATTNPATATAQQALTFTNAAQRVMLQLGSLAQGHVYKASIGLFDQNNHLVKWFDSLAVLRLQGGVPQLQAKVVEDPCGQQIQSNNN
jgi:hypothetical protein